MRYTVEPVTRPLGGTVRVPSDKSISHRAVLLGAMARGVTRVRDVLDAADVRSSIEAVRMLGARVEAVVGMHGLDLAIEGWDDAGPRSPSAPIDCGNSGTTARLMTGILAGHKGVVVELRGDASLSARPMRRVVEPLSQMGARITTSASGTLPLVIEGVALGGAHHDLPIASAQVKSALLLAGIHANGRTTVCEPYPSRDHTERMLPAFGVGVERRGTCATVEGPARLEGCELSVPGDPSSAAFMVAAAVMVQGSDVILRDVALNETRTGFVRVLERMGASIEVLTSSTASFCEPVGSLRVRGCAKLTATCVTPEEVPSLIDEIPVLAVVATMAEGTTRFEGVGELRVKESDRLAAIVEAIRALGGSAEIDGDALLVSGPRRLHGGTVPSRGDHRLAMAFAVAGCAASSAVVVEGFDAVDVSYPNFAGDLEALRAP